MEDPREAERQRIADNRVALLVDCACPGVIYRVDDFLDMDQAEFEELLVKQREERRKYDERIASEAMREAEAKQRTK